MKKIIIKGSDLARIDLWKELGEPQEHQEVVLYQLEEGESFPVGQPVKPEIADKELINARRLVMLLSTGFKVCDKSVATHWCNIYEDKAMYNVYIQP